MLNETNTLLEDDGIEEEILVEEECSVAQAVWGDIQGDIENQTDLQNALDAKQDSLTEAQLNAVNSGITAGKVTTYDGYANQIASKADQTALNAESITRGEADTALGTRIDNEALARQQADNGLQSQIDAITSKSDVVDVVANYAALQAYDTSTLGNNDVIKVLNDETHEDALTYYRWSTTTQTWSYIGQEAPYYSKGQMDVKLAEKQDKLTAGANIQIQNGTISATDTTYTAGNGLTLTGTEFSADTDILATQTDLAGYYTKTETDTLLAPKLEAEVVAELPTTGEEGKLYLTPKAHTTQTATGNPITATVAEDAGALESFQLDGDTYQQTYEGKNLVGFPTGSFTQDGLTFDFAADGTITIDGTREGTSASNYNNSELYNFPVGNITLTVIPISGNYTGANIGYRTVGATIPQPWYQGYSPNGYNQGTIITTADRVNNVRYIQFLIGSGTAVFNNFKFKLQVTAGTTHDTTYEPYVGGTASPNPDYPQAIQTVTGKQAVSINGTDYEIDLGSIELCKLGTYQDYIWKGGEDWKVHKAIGKYIFTGEEAWVWDDVRIPRLYLASGRLTNIGIYAEIPPNANTLPIGKTNRFTPKTFQAFYTESGGNGFAMSTAGQNFQIGDNSWTSEESAKADVEGLEWIYALATGYATDTAITNQSLIDQLEAIRTASLQNGANTITNTATGSNLAGDMEIGYYGFAPRNRYDKFIWLDINNEYEQIGS